MSSPDKTIRHEPVPQEVLDLLSRYETAFNTNDPDKMSSLFTEDCTFVNFGGNLVLGRSDLHRAQSEVFATGGPLERIEVNYRPEYAELLDSEHALVHARQRTKSSNGEPLAEDPMEAVFTMLLTRTSRDWRIRMGQNTPVSS